MNAQLPLPAQLSDTINSLGGAAAALADEVRSDRAERQAAAEADRAERRLNQRRQNWLLVIIGVLVAALFGLSVYSRLLGNQTRSVISTIESCTNAEGECAKESQKRTAQVIGQLVGAVVEVQACGLGQPTVAEYRACVDKALAGLAPAPAPEVPLPSVPVPSLAP